MGPAHTITFQTSKFDVTKETSNPINPSFGQSMLQWLGDRLRDAYEVGTPDTEDWGWYVDVKGPEANLTGANKLTPDDALTARIASLLRADPEIRDVEVET